MRCAEIYDTNDDEIFTSTRGVSSLQRQWICSIRQSLLTSQSIHAICCAMFADFVHNFTKNASLSPLLRHRSCRLSRRVFSTSAKALIMPIAYGGFLLLQKLFSNILFFIVFRYVWLNLANWQLHMVQHVSVCVCVQFNRIHNIVFFPLRLYYLLFSIRLIIFIKLDYFILCLVCVCQQPVIIVWIGRRGKTSTLFSLR